MAVSRVCSRFNIPKPAVDLTAGPTPPEEEGTFLSVLLQTIHTNRCSKWPIGYVFLVGSNRVLHAFYVGCAEPKLLLLVDFGSINNPLITVLGASAYAEPLMIGCALSVMQTFEHACCSGFSKNCLVEHQLGGLKNKIIYCFVMLIIFWDMYSKVSMVQLIR